MNEVLLKVYVKEKHNVPEMANLFLICAKLKKFTEPTLSKTNFGI